MSDDRLELTISWQGASKARLHYVIANDEVVKTEVDDLEGYSPISCACTTTSAAVHVIEWSLWFPGKAVKNLVATISINGGPPVTLDTKKDETKNKWASRGAAP